MSGPDEVGGCFLTAEVLLSEGDAPDGRAPADRRLLAALVRERQEDFPDLSW